jgi:hypothetical protein
MIKTQRNPTGNNMRWGFPLWMTFALVSPILTAMFNLPHARVCNFVFCCKGCRENVPAPVGTMPDSWIAAKCPLCGDRWRYLPSEIFNGRLSHRLGPKAVPAKGRS